MWATGVGGAVRKKGAGDGGFLYKTILIYLKGGLSGISPQTCAHETNRHKSKDKCTQSATKTRQSLGSFN